MSAKKKLILVSPCIPDPEGTGSEQRAYSFLLAYSKLFSVELWTWPRFDNIRLKRLHKLKEACAEIYLLHPALLTSNFEGMTEAFNEALRGADCVHLFKDPIPIEHPCIFWDYDELPQEIRMASVMSLGPRGEFWRHFAMKCKLIYASSDLEKLPLIPSVITVPNVYHEIKPLEDAKAKRDNLLFVGNLSYPPNLDAISYFLSEIFPVVSSRLKLQIVGTKPAQPEYRQRLAEISQQKRVEIFYDVETCSPFYKSALAAVVPLRKGSGTRLKILEAFAHGCPVVSTSKGCEGLNVRDGNELLVRDAPTEFALACNKLMEDPNLRDRLSELSRKFLLDNNSQQIVETLIGSALKSRLPRLIKANIRS